jgi:hypothetical protein
METQTDLSGELVALLVLDHEREAYLASKKVQDGDKLSIADQRLERIMERERAARIANLQKHEGACAASAPLRAVGSRL